MRLEGWLHLITPDERKVRVRAGLFIVVCYLPLVLLAGVQDLAYGGSSLRSVLADFGSLARYLIAAPLFIIAESVCFPKFQRIVAYFRDSGLIANSDRHRYEDLVRSSVRLLRSKTAEILSFVAAYVITAYWILAMPPNQLISWSYGSGTGLGSLSAAGKWHAMVTVPLFLVLVLGWLWRQLSWARFLWLVSRMNLQLIAAHPDRCGGLKFISTIIPGYRPLAFACTAIIAGGIANRITQAGASLGSFRDVMIAVVIGIVLFCVAPLGAFAPGLRRLRSNGTFEYGHLGRDIGGQFEQKWLVHRECRRQDLEVPDYSATTDLYSIVGNVYNISPIPFGFDSVRELLIFTALPFVPVLLIAQPAKSIVDTLVKLLVS